MEELYQIKLKEFSDNFLSYPNFKNDGDFFSLDFTEINPYIRHVKIFCRSKNLYLNINQNFNNDYDDENNNWDVTILNGEITLFSNGYYLNVNSDNETIEKFQYMKIWNFKEINDEFYFIWPGKENNVFHVLIRQL